MNKKDRNNLQFLLETYSEGPEAFNEWADSVDPEDLEYGLGLLLNYRLQKENFDNIISQIFD